MSQAYQLPGPSAQAPREKHGCLFWGCLAAMVLVLLTIGCSYVGYHYVVGKLQQAIETYTAGAPESFPTVAMPDEQRQVTLQRADAVRQRFEVEPALRDNRCPMNCVRESKSRTSTPVRKISSPNPHRLASWRRSKSKTAG